ncbi:MAG: hypothetical protein JXB07_14945 [Anaerolineae bacterium]|nr:hypothetical protein [Anaerolineae bacterium]
MEPMVFRIFVTISGALLFVTVARMLPYLNFGEWIKDSRSKDPAQRWLIRFLPFMVLINGAALLREYTPLIKYRSPTTQELIGSGLLLIMSIALVFQSPRALAGNEVESDADAADEDNDRVR